MFLDTGEGRPRKVFANSGGTLFEAEPRLAPRRARTVFAVLNSQQATREARLLAAALRGCRAIGDDVQVFVLPAGGESQEEDARKNVSGILGTERVESIPPPRPAVARGPAQGQMRRAYRFYEFLKLRAPNAWVEMTMSGARSLRNS